MKWLISILLFISAQITAAQPQKAYLLEIQGAIGPAVADYVVRGISQAERAHATTVVIQMDTPGGLAQSMHEINKAILASRIPVVSYVSPSGARAASAGTYILFASHFAAMAPGTNLGAASPVSLGMTGSSSNKDSTMMKKALNDATAYIRSLAELRGRNVEWAMQAVVKADSLSDQQALAKNVINFIADDFPQLFAKLNGQKTTIQGQPVLLTTDNIRIQKIEPDWRSRFLSVITDPSVAYILLLVGFYGLFLEFTNPGVILPGVLGAIALLIGLYALQLLPISYVGLALIFLGLGFLVSEVYITSHGVLGLGGIIAFVIGSVMLMDTNVIGFGIPLSLIFAVTIGMALLVLVIVQLVLRAQHKPEVTGIEAVLSGQGVVEAIHGKRYQVRIEGELWQAECRDNLKIGQRVVVRDVQGLILLVEPWQGD